MKKRLRSRVLALGVAGTTLLGSWGLSREAQAQDKPPAAASLAQAKKNFDLKHYAEAKAALDDINASQLPEDQRQAYADLKAQVASALAAAPAGGSGLESAKAAIEAKKYAKAVELLKGIIDSPSSSDELKAQANQQLAVAQAEQKNLAPKMVELLKSAETSIDAGKLDEAGDALSTVEDTGAPLGFENEGKPANLRKRIADKRATALAAATMTSVAASTPTVTPPASAPNALTRAATMEFPATPAIDTEPAPAPHPEDLLDKALVTNQIETQRHRNNFNLAMERAKKARDATPPDFDVTIHQADEARHEIDSAKRYFTEDEYQAMAAEASGLKEKAQAMKEADLAKRDDEANRQAVIKEQELGRLRQKQRAEKIAILFRDADTLLQQQQYPEAADALRQILVIEPYNNAAKLSLRLTEDTIAFRVFEHLNKVQGQEFLKQAIISKELLIPYADLLVYPEDWVEISRYRIAEYQNSLDSPRNRAVRERLEQTLQGVIKTDPTGEFAAVLERWRVLTGLNVVPNWKTIEQTIPKNTQISIDLHDVTARQALNLILEEASGGQTTPLAYAIDEGIIRISTQEEINKKHKITRTYNVRELLLPANTKFQVPQVGTNGNNGIIGNNGNNNGGGGGGLFNNGGNNNGGGNNNNNNGGNNQAVNTFSSLAAFDQAGYDAAALKLMQTIAENVDRESSATIDNTPWTGAGTGAFGTMRNFEGTLIITTSSDDHEKVYDLLARIREIKTILISIESRMLLVSNNFLDDFGLGWNLNFVPVGAGTSLGGSITGPAGAGPIGIANGSFAQAVPVATGVPGSLAGTTGAGALSTSFSIGTILDNWQLSIFLRATQADKRTTSVSAPRLTMFDDDTAQISFSQNVAYVAGFNNNIITNGGGILGGGVVVAGGPNIGNAQANTTLTVHATVSPDRRYVSMNIQPHTETLDGFDTITFGAASQNAVATAGGGNSIAIPTAGNIIQLPRTRTTDLQTRVTIPDGGTLLIGGQKLVGESEIEVGVPVLSKIPGLNRLFTNRSFVRDEQTLLILVRPRIIIQREQEIRRFGVDYDRPSNLPRLEGGAAALPGKNDSFSNVPSLGIGGH